MIISTCARDCRSWDDDVATASIGARSQFADDSGNGTTNSGGRLHRGGSATGRYILRLLHCHNYVIVLHMVKSENVFCFLLPPFLFNRRERDGLFNQTTCTRSPLASIISEPREYYSTFHYGYFNSKITSCKYLNSMFVGTCLVVYIQVADRCNIPLILVSCGVLTGLVLCWWYDYDLDVLSYLLWYLGLGVFALIDSLYCNLAFELCILVIFITFFFNQTISSIIMPCYIN
jgi:hypothetical protein